MPLVWRRKTSHPENSLFGSHYLAQASIWEKRRTFIRFVALGEYRHQRNSSNDGLFFLVGYARKRKLHDTEGRQEKAPFRKKGNQGCVRSSSHFLQIVCRFLRIFFYWSTVSNGGKCHFKYLVMALKFHCKKSRPSLREAINFCFTTNYSNSVS